MTALATRRQRIGKAIAIAVLATIPATATTIAATTSPAAAGPVYHAIDADNDPYNGIYLRQGTDMNNVVRTAEWYITYGTSIELLCGQTGTPTGPRANNRWHNVRVVNGPNTGRIGWISDRYTDTPNAASTPTPGEPECGSTPAPPPAPTPPPASGGNASTEVWCGSPVDGTWAAFASSTPAQHGIFFGGDWSVDLPAAAGQSAQIFCAPQDGRSDVTARVDNVRPACRSGVHADGGQVVTVGLYNGSARIGFMAIAHVNATVSTGQTISRWGGSVGNIGAYRSNSCADGAHAHVEMYNTSRWSCYNRTYRVGQRIGRSNFIGFVGGARGTGQRAGCP